MIYFSDTVLSPIERPQTPLNAKEKVHSLFLVHNTYIAYICTEAYLFRIDVITHCHPERYLISLICAIVLECSV